MSMPQALADTGTEAPFGRGCLDIPGAEPGLDSPQPKPPDEHAFQGSLRPRAAPLSAPPSGRRLPELSSVEY